MPFDIALSGIRAASNDLSITGNNIANASTTGFKASRAEFADAYATSILGSGASPIGSGVRLQDVSQQFTQGSISYTESGMDLAINGNGFFVVQSEGEQFYTRSGAFGLDTEGYIVNNIGAKLQGFPADDIGNVSGLQDDLRVQTSNLSPRPTTGVKSLLNLDASESVLQQNGRSLQTDGSSIGVSQAGLSQGTTTTAAGDVFTLPMPIDFTADSISFDLELTASSGNNGTLSVNLNSAAGLPATITTFNDLRTVASVINAQVFSPTPPALPIDVIASAVDDGGGNYHMEFKGLQEGESSQVRVLNGSANAPLLGVNGTVVSATGIVGVSNGYPSQSIDITDSKGQLVTYTTQAGAAAASVAAGLNALAGVSATAFTQVEVIAANYNNANGNLLIDLNGVELASTSLSGLGDAINLLSSSTLPGISAELDLTSGNLLISSSVGGDIRVGINSPDDGDSIEVIGSNDSAPSAILEVDTDATLNIPRATAADGNSIVVGGYVDIVLEEGYSLENPSPPFVGLFGVLDPSIDGIYEDVTLNEFNPDDQTTYNSATSMTIYDSLGASHVLTQYFVREEFDTTDPTTFSNHWTMYVQIDGEDVGDPDTTLAPPENTLPARASYNIRFNEDGSLNTLLTDDVFISNWTPLDESGEPNGALGPLNVLSGGSTTIDEPPVNSNFVVDLTGTTQFGSAFAVNDVAQNGYTTGRLSGLNIDESGIIFARFSNGESQVLGQVVLSDFTNTQGLQPVGESMWAENYESGTPNVGVPGSGSLGAIQSGALEESNVDLSQELVALIIAQRNFQASAKTIETANQVTQTIINLR